MVKTMAGYVSDVVIRRLPGYYRNLCELEQAGVTQISSKELGERMRVTASQIRQDINCFGGFGRQGFGYPVTELKNRLAEIMGLTNNQKMIVVGAGNIGKAVACYQAFQRDGFQIAAVFDQSPSVIGQNVGGFTVRDVATLDAFLEENPVEVAVLALPVSQAQKTADALIAKGIQGFWNFAPVDLVVPGNICLVNVHLSDSLQVLSYKMQHREDEEGTGHNG